MLAKKKRKKERKVRQFIASSDRVVEIAFVEWASVSGSLAQNFVELVLEEGAHKITDHVVVVAHVKNGGYIQILGGITSHWRRNSDDTSPSFSFKVIHLAICQVNEIFVNISNMILFSPVLVVELLGRNVTTEHVPSKSVLN